MGLCARFAVGLSLLLTGVAAPLYAAGLTLNPGQTPDQCAHVGLSADEAQCDDSRCVLTGHAQMTCDALTLWADRIDILMTPDRQFGGAEAQGQGLLVEGGKVVRCERIRVLPDRVQGAIDVATIEVRKDTPPPGTQGVPPGRNQAVLHGNMERLDRDHIVLHQGDITLCDCGADQPPSWRFDGAEIDAKLGDRVTVWWPLVRINPFGLGLIPITPPLAPLSIPLQKRAMGFLLPEPQFLGGGWPTLDLPFFIPLGDSWDIKIAPGLRSDWGNHGHPFGIHALGAPRAGVRLRYAPTPQTHGIANFQLTHDGAHAMATSVYLADRSVGVDTTTPQYQLLNARRRALVNRMSADIKHVTRFTSDMEWVLDGRWVSDDLVNQNFLLAIDERFSAYLPSRTQLMWRSPSLVGWAAADFVLRLDSQELGPGPGPHPTPDQVTLLPVYSNLDGAEAGTLHRWPDLGVQLLPWHLGWGIYTDGSLSWVRYGTLLNHATHLSPVPTDPRAYAQNILNGTVALAFNHALGPVNVAARAGVDTVWIGTESGAATADIANIVDTALVLAADADVHLLGHHGDTWHSITPRLLYRALPARWAPAAARSATFPILLDGRLVRRLGHQGMAVLSQSLWQGAPQIGNIASLDIGQPVDLITGQLLQPWAQLSWTAPAYGGGSLWISLDPTDWRRVPEMTVQWAMDSTFIGLMASYERFAPNADRFQRSIYELATPRLPPPPPPPAPPPGMFVDSTWAHLARGSATVHLFNVFNATYSTTFQLPRPGQQGGEPACLDPRSRAQSPRPSAPPMCFIQHSVAIAYKSPCDCWGLRYAVSAEPQDIGGTLRQQIFFEVAGYQLGGAPPR